MHVSEKLIYYRMEEKLYNRFQKVVQILCNINSANLRSLEQSLFHQNALIRIRGQICQELSCSEVILTVSKGETHTESCYDSLISVNLDGQPLFIDATTMTLLEDGTLHEVSCQA